MNIFSRFLRWLARPARGGSAFTIMETQKLGATASCEKCGHGKVISFNFPYFHKATSDDGLSYSNALDKLHDCKAGSLYRCRYCRGYWYLDDGGVLMHSVDDDALPFLEKWSAAPISMAPELMEQLREIGETPVDMYGNGAGSRDYPCGVVMRNGQRIDMAMVSFRTNAPVSNWKNCHLADEIAEIYPSPFALPQDVRLATSKAQEMRMGFCPTLVEMPDGTVYTLNWTTSFFTEAGYDAREVRICDKRIDMQDIPPISHLDGEIAVFLVDAIKADLE